MQKKLSKKIRNYIDKNTAFNLFGILNIATLRASTGTRLKRAEIIKRVNAEFGREVNGKIEFKGN